MELKIISENQNPLFDRKEILGEVESVSAPSREEISKLISEKFSTSPDKFKLRKIEGRFGSRVFGIDVHIYNSVEERNKIVPKTKKEIEAEKKALEAKAAEEKAAKEAAAKEEEEKKVKEAEENKEEAPVEEKNETAPEGVPSNVEVEGKEKKE